MSTMIEADTFDDLLHRVLERIIANGGRIEPSKGPALEETAVLLRLTNPRSRLSRSYGRSKLVSALGELCWYLSGSDDLESIRYYIPQMKRDANGGRLEGAYGPRLFRGEGGGQFPRVIQTLKDKKDSRQAVIQVFDESDLSRDKDIPCTCTLQFLLRDSLLDLVVTMRSNDAYIGLPHDLFSFTMLQELVARSLGVEIGAYSHFVGSLHLYDRNRSDADEYLGEGWYSPSTASMPPMPGGDPWAAVGELVSMEHRIRTAEPADLDLGSLGGGYWGDLAKVLAAFRYRWGQPDQIPVVAGALANQYFEIFVTDQIHKGPRTP